MADLAASTSEKRQHHLGELIVLIGALTSLFTGIREFVGEAKGLGEAMGSLGFIVGVPAGVVLIGVGLYVRFNKTSRLLKIDALTIDSDNPDHLLGRREKIDQLEHLCRENYLVHLVGESGAGKSALVRAGLVPKLDDNDSILPVYMDAWGQDWEMGPRTALLDATWSQLSAEDRARLNRKTRPKPDQLAGLLDKLQSKLGRTPLVIFDQFDDYQARHREQFIVGRKQTLLPTEDLLEANPFWSEINQLLVDRRIRCLFVTRDDSAAGLESVRFLKPQVFPLERPPMNIVEELLTTLTTAAEGEPAVVRHPDHGWNRLKRRVGRDLAEDGMVLPVRLRLVIQGLGQLKTLTVRAYDAAGASAGLEAGFIESRIKNAARMPGAEGVDEKQVRDMLLSLVDREALKTIGKQVADLKLG